VYPAPKHYSFVGWHWSRSRRDVLFKLTEGEGLSLKVFLSVSVDPAGNAAASLTTKHDPDRPVKIVIWPKAPF